MGNFALIKLKIKKRTYLLAVFPHFFNILNLALRIRAVNFLFLFPKVGGFHIFVKIDQIDFIDFQKSGGPFF